MHRAQLKKGVDIVTAGTLSNPYLLKSEPMQNVDLSIPSLQNTFLIFRFALNPSLITWEIISNHRPSMLIEVKDLLKAG